MFIVPLFAIAKIWMQSKCSLTDKCMSIDIYMCACMCVCVCVCVCTRSCPTHCHPMNCSPPGSSVHGVFQAIILEQVAISYSKGSSPPRYRICVSCISCIVRRFLYHSSHLGGLYMYSLSFVFGSLSS